MRKQIKQNNGSQFNKKQTKQNKVINWFASVTLMFSVCLGASFSTLALNSEIKNNTAQQDHTEVSEQQVRASALHSQLTYVIENLPNAVFSTVREGWTHDYGLTEGPGLLNTFEYLRSLVPFESLQNDMPMSIFLSGPHYDDQLVLTSKYTFGHYNPEFVKYFGSVVSELLSNKSFVSATKSRMEKYGLLNNLAGLQIIYRMIEKDQASFNKFKSQYQQKLLDGTWPEGGYSFNLPAELNEQYYWNWSETHYYFWVRRDIDGTKELWSPIIDSIIYAYTGRK
jgi:hypothetical protein